MFQIIKHSLLITLTCSLFSCSNLKDIEKPAPFIEYQQPYVLSEAYQVESVGVTQLSIHQESDVATLEEGNEYVFWSSTPNSIFSANEVVDDADIEVNSNIVKISDESDVSTKSDVQAIKPRTCKKIFCDIDKQEECGAISWCGDDWCDKDKRLKKTYDCTEESCTPKYVSLPFLDSRDCSTKGMELHPNCLGKGDQICVNHGELFYCNNLARECKE
ncbi:hypothetical protein [Thalassotalea piscium]|uniref:Uncharacterized protein n=1 Tax=Thalassotalea piscium TaxID=1230533 RepID=A0A7X0NKM5_9GAMM|nr:hypothetical protein [Thalassotalea piscium]MBB6545141.1 hypothetical protein [Thalassotalea piscium]